MGVRNRSRRGILLLAVALAVLLAVVAVHADSGAPHGAPVRHRVVSVDVEGNRAVSEEEILAVVKIKAGDVLSESEAKEKVAALLELGTFSNAVARLEPTAGGRKLVIVVEEYPQVKGYQFDGNTVFTDEELSAMVSLKPGETLDTNVLDQDLAAILKAYEAREYAVALSDVSLSADGYVKVSIAEQRLGQIVIEGNEKTQREVIERELDLVEGDLVNFAEIRDNLSKLYRLGIFSEIVPSLEASSEEGVVDLKLELTEARTGSFAAGIGYNSADGFLGYLEASENNLLGRNLRLALSLEVGKGAQNYALSFANPWMDNERTSLEAAIYSRSGQRVGYTETRQGGNLAVGRPVTDDTRVDLTLKVEQTRNTWDGEAPEGVSSGGATRSVGFRVLNDTRDDVTDPRAGGVLKGSTELAGGLLGGDYDFNKYEFQATRFFSIKPNQTVGLRLGYGTSTGELPSHEMYEIGGSETVRGYRYREFLGSSMLYGNAEYRYRINDTVQAVAFADVGDAWTEGGPVKLSDLKTGYGIGVRITTPIGVIRLDYGMGRTDGNLYFSLGQTF